MLSIFHTGAQFNQPIVARIDTHLTSTARHSRRMPAQTARGSLARVEHRRSANL
jgi:hypothetical protein